MLSESVSFLKNEALLTRAKTHHVPVLVSIGGGSASGETIPRAVGGETSAAVGASME